MTLTTPTEERCTWSDLFVSQCAHCRGLTLDLHPSRASLPAKEPGICQLCELPYEKGDRVTAFGDGFFCGHCRTTS